MMNFAPNTVPGALTLALAYRVRPKNLLHASFFFWTPHLRSGHIMKSWTHFEELLEVLWFVNNMIVIAGFQESVRMHSFISFIQQYFYLGSRSMWACSLVCTAMFSEMLFDTFCV